MSGTRVILVAGVRYLGPPGREAEFDCWYSETHAPFVLQLGASSFARYRLMRTLPGATEQRPPEFLAIYEFETREAYEAFEATGFNLTLEQRREMWPDEHFEPAWGVAYEEVTASAGRSPFSAMSQNA
jgi:hypothetical protein